MTAPAILTKGSVVTWDISPARDLPDVAISCAVSSLVCEISPAAGSSGRASVKLLGDTKRNGGESWRFELTGEQARALSPGKGDTLHAWKLIAFNPKASDGAMRQVAAGVLTITRAVTSKKLPSSAKTSPQELERARLQNRYSCSTRNWRSDVF